METNLALQQQNQFLTLSEAEGTNLAETKSIYQYGTALSDLQASNPDIYKKRLNDLFMFFKTALGKFDIKKDFFFYLVNAAQEKDKTIEWLEAATKHVAETSRFYPVPADFFSFDKSFPKDLNELCTKGGRKWTDFSVYELPDGTKEYWDKRDGKAPADWKFIRVVVH